MPQIPKTMYDRVLIGILIGVLSLGTVFYHFVEGFSWLDSLYFCVITLATVGYGDFHPVTTAGKLFTILYVFVGVGILVSAFGVFSSRLIDRRITRREHWTQKKRER